MVKICPKCGNNNNEYARYCSKCGTDLSGRFEADPDRTFPEDFSGDRSFNYRPGDTGRDSQDVFSRDTGRNSLYGQGPGPGAIPPGPPPGTGSPPDFSPDPGGDGGSGLQKALIAASVCISLLIIGLSILLIKSYVKDKDSDQNTTVAEQETTAVTEEYTSTTEAVYTEPATEETQEVTEYVPPATEAVRSGLPYCNNDDMYFRSHGEVGDFYVMTAGDGSFTFSYPKYIFNYSEENEEGTEYYMSYTEGGYEYFSMNYRKTYDPGNQKERALEAQRRYKSQLYKPTYTADYEREKNNGYQYIALATGEMDSTASRGMYALAENDGEYTYEMILYYDNFQGEEGKRLQYIINNVYRQCSFAMSKKQPSSYEQMLKEGVFE